MPECSFATSTVSLIIDLAWMLDAGFVEKRSQSLFVEEMAPDPADSWRSLNATIHKQLSDRRSFLVDAVGAKLMVLMPWMLLKLSVPAANVMAVLSIPRRAWHSPIS